MCVHWSVLKTFIVTWANLVWLPFRLVFSTHVLRKLKQLFEENNNYIKPRNFYLQKRTGLYPYWWDLLSISYHLTYLWVLYIDVLVIQHLDSVNFFSLPLCSSVSLYFQFLDYFWLVVWLSNYYKMLNYFRPRKINVLVLIRTQLKKDKAERFSSFFSSFFLNWKINVLILIRKKKKNDEGERKYHIIRKMHAFHVFPKTEYLMRSVALFFNCCKN